MFREISFLVLFFVIFINPSDALDSSLGVKNSQSQAISRFPEIGISGSEANKRFLLAVEEAKKARPDLFKTDDWPMKIAREAESVYSLKKALLSRDLSNIAKEASGFLNPNQEVQIEINTLGEKVKKLINELQIIKRKEPSISETVVKLRKNAEVNEKYSGILSGASDHKLKAESQRKAAVELLESFARDRERSQQEQEELLSRISNLVDAVIIANLQKVQTQNQKLEQIASARTESPDKAVDNLKAFSPDNAVDDLKGFNIESSEFTSSPRGPRIHGFHLGCTVQEFEDNLKKIFPDLQKSICKLGMEPEIPVGDLVGRPGLTAVPILYSDIQKTKLARVYSVGKEKTVVYIYLDTPLVNKIFNIVGMRGWEFAENIAGSYNLPKLKEYKGGFIERPFLRCSSDDGWALSVKLGSDQSGPALEFLLTTKTADRGFDSVEAGDSSFPQSKEPSGELVGARGPIIHGLQIGMTKPALISTLREIMPEIEPSDAVNGFKIPMEDLTGKPNDLWDGVMFKSPKSRQRWDVVVAFEKTSSRLAYIRLEQTFIERFLKVQDMKFDDFCQLFMSHAKIPKMEGKVSPSSANMLFASKDGWVVNLVDEREYVQYDPKKVIELKATTPNASRGFGR
jgi:hypothetical protein